MSKILNINDGIKINKNNVQLPYAKLTKGSNTGTTISFTLNTWVNNTVVLILVDGNPYVSLVMLTIHDKQLTKTTIVGDSETTASISENVITINTRDWSHATLIDFGNNSWS